MTNLGALKAKTQYPLSDDAFELALINRGVTPNDTYVIENLGSVELAWADVICSMLTSPGSVSEGGYSISLGERGSLMTLANNVYIKHGLLSPFSGTATFVQRW